ncbi:hypothetical protein PE066_18945 [Ramlibacter tataouinensis]|uniref:hypothetical protein n=1 Tax=Ramlibacter tataouinensis TaxID=94132 RepID=UPI0022F3B7C0|nr:hypothetical protein [Ramlibacter tataouinensis]WBY01517.1 hypothetical protein PE066_18945 [Ramlibacter tataouinensis]
MREDEKEDLLLVFNQQSTLVDDPEPSRFVHSIEGEVRVLDVDDDEGVSAGEFRVILIDLEGAVNEGVDPDAVFDSEAVVHAYQTLYDEDLEFTPAVLKAIGGDDLWRPNLLILDRVALVPEVRGKGHGLWVLRWLVLQLAQGCGIVAMKPFPLQFESGSREDPAQDRYRLADLPADERSATHKLQRYYGRLGFTRVTGTEFMVLNPQSKRFLDAGKKLP